MKSTVELLFSENELRIIIFLFNSDREIDIPNVKVLSLINLSLSQLKFDSPGVYQPLSSQIKEAWWQIRIPHSQSGDIDELDTIR